MQTVKIASRKSILALAQTGIVIDMLKTKYKDTKFEIITVDTKGDMNLDTKLSEIGSKGLFTFEIEQMLLNKTVDMAVHSLKDMPTQFDDNLEISAYIKRHSHKDIIIFNNGYNSITALPENAKIGTSSIRREIQLKKVNPSFNICSIRGNIHTRLKKMKDENFDAIILAKAGFERLNMLNDIKYQELPFISAVGQGCICVESHKNNTKISDMLVFLNDEKTKNCVIQEREFLRYIGGSCHTPIGAYCSFNKNSYEIEGFVATKDSNKFLYQKIRDENFENLGYKLYNKLINMGADKILY